MYPLHNKNTRTLSSWFFRRKKKVSVSERKSGFAVEVTAGNKPWSAAFHDFSLWKSPLTVHTEGGHSVSARSSSTLCEYLWQTIALTTSQFPTLTICDRLPSRRGSLHWDPFKLDFLSMGLSISSQNPVHFLSFSPLSLQRSQDNLRGKSNCKQLPSFTQLPY